MDMGLQILIILLMSIPALLLIILGVTLIAIVLDVCITIIGCVIDDFKRIKNIGK